MARKTIVRGGKDGKSRSGSEGRDICKGTVTLR
jgi:hypothetical protein